jgi:hypothetical protein
MTKAERERKLRKLVQEGDRATALSDFLVAFEESEKQKAVEDLMKSTRPPELVRAELKASMRLIEYINGVAQLGKLAKTKMEDN